MFFRISLIIYFTHKIFSVSIVMIDHHNFFMKILKKKKLKKLRKAKRKFFKFLRPLADIKLLIFAIAIVMVWR